MIIKKVFYIKFALLFYQKKNVWLEPGRIKIRKQMYIPPYHQQYDTDEHKDRGQSQDPHHRSGGYQPLVEVLVNPCPFHVSRVLW